MTILYVVFYGISITLSKDVQIYQEVNIIIYTVGGSNNSNVFTLDETTVYIEYNVFRTRDVTRMTTI